MEMEKLDINRSCWFRAAVLSAKDGILSITSLAIGVAAASITREPVLLASVAGLTAGALSMAAGEYVFVSSQSDIETADLKKENEEINKMPEEKLNKLTRIFIQKGINTELAKEVVAELSSPTTFDTETIDELETDEIKQVNPLMSAFAAAMSFMVGGLLPLLVVILAPIKEMVLCQYTCSILFLILSGVLAAKASGSNIFIAALRLSIWSTFVMGISALVGYVLGN
ncbi:VIT family protein [Flavobacterium sp. Fl-318]|uniref:VIT family protein n=2 Tax=Flavobacterium cupriresistens TaxID=2893885 RepID=A0ABU4RCY7_9FLAO|nr:MULTISPECIES: VIT family protein [unclassified Flavobacterium]MDX6189325.1 VIT family protein [Flavobacterium sp. Fl-318]UFH41420.1 VIT family protein [Flavobacterium sp. F-323]